ncbi:MAG: J domain-containing protein [Bacteroidales bacterium]|jgi:hypothetical protein|nr:J domain-containing protein [Bacteroidales bacterium]MBR4349834.1 J domain-containing protein [Bacteroidales bacterium]MBR6265336.1 J domain-containing protein [Bacteroidales bacterium]
MFFDDCNPKDKEQIKKRYRFWVAKLHPDKNGDNDLFVKMQTEYEVILKGGTQTTQKKKAEPTLMEMILQNPLIRNLATDVVNQTTKHLLEGIDKTSDTIQQLLRNDLKQ